MRLPSGGRTMLRGLRGATAQRLPRSHATPVPASATRPSLSSIISAASGHRDSDDSSICSSHPSSAAGPSSSFSTASAPSDRPSQLRAVNSYLSSLSPSIHLKPPLPPARDISAAFGLLVSRLHLKDHHSISDICRDLPPILSVIRCPFKLSKSALKAPSTPHAWPSVLSVLHWLVQFARAIDHLTSPTTPPLPDNGINGYLTRSYSLFLSGEDCAVANLDAEYLDRVERHAASAAKDVEALEAEVAQTKAKFFEASAAPSQLEALEAARAALVEDVTKFQNVVDKFAEMIEDKKEKLAERERALEAKEMERRRLEEENEGLRQRIKVQSVSTRDVDRMKRELQAVERDISEGECRRNEVEEKAWLLNSDAERKFRELEAMTEQSNQAIRKLKLGNNFQHVLNAKASSAAEVIGMDYKTMLKPALSGMAEEAKKAKVLLAEEVINLQKQSLDNETLLGEKRAECAALQTKICEVEAQVDLVKKETEEHSCNCASEAEKTKEEVKIKEHQVEILEREAHELLMRSEEKLKLTIIESTKETQLCAQELLALIDSVSTYKEFTSSTITGIREEMKVVAEGVKQAYDLRKLSGLTITGLQSRTCARWKIICLKNYQLYQIQVILPQQRPLIRPSLMKVGDYSFLYGYKFEIFSDYVVYAHPS